MKKIWIMLCGISILCSIFFLPIKAETKENDIISDVKSAYLIENITGKVIYAKNENEKLYPASMTKMMGLLLIYEAIHDKKLQLDEMVSVSAYAASMGGSQVFLEENETLSVEDMLKSICISSANDAMVAMGEKVGGSNDHFVEMMNEKAKELKLEKTNFINSTGLHDPDHYTCAKDMAIIAQALVKEGGDEVLQITSTYDSYIRENSDEKFWLVNTNKLLKQYPGVDGLKTGFTSEALSCITVTAKKQGLRLIGVIMGAPSSSVRNARMKQMLDYGFSQYAQGLLYAKNTKIDTLKMENGKPESVSLVTLEDMAYVFEKGSEPKEIKKEIILSDDTPPYKKDKAIGKIRITMSDGYIIEGNIGVEKNVEALDFGDIFLKAFHDVFV